MLRKHWLRYLLAVIIILAFLANGSALASRPNPSLTAPFRIEKVDYPADTFTGTHISLHLMPSFGVVYMSYYDVTHHSLRLAYNSISGNNVDCSGITGRWYCLTLDGDGQPGHSINDVGMYSSMDLIEPLVVGISYYDKTLAAVKFITYACFFQCTETIETVDDPGMGRDAGGYGTSLRYDHAGVAYIAYSFTNPADHAQDAVKLAHKVTSGGNCGDGPSFGKWQCDVIDQGLFMGRSPSLAIDDTPGTPIKLAYLGTSNELRFAFSNNGGPCVAGSAPNWICVLVDAHAAADISIASYNGITSIAYYDPLEGDINYANYTGPIPDANCGWYFGGYTFRCDSIDTVGTNLPRASVSMVMDSQGYPTIAYEKVPEFGAVSLNIARPLAAYNYDVGNCGPVPPGDLFPSWLCSTVDGGGANTNEAAFAALGVNNNGMVTIAFTEDDTYNDTQRLMIALQLMPKYLPVVKK